MSILVFALRIIKIELTFLLIETSPSGKTIDFRLIVDKSSFKFFSKVGE